MQPAPITMGSKVNAKFSMLCLEKRADARLTWADARVSISDRARLFRPEAVALSGSTSVTRVSVRKEVDTRGNKRAGSNSEYVGLRAQIACVPQKVKSGREHSVTIAVL